MSFSSDSAMLFLAVFDKGSFSAAARSLKRVPSAVSMAIANLEAELGYELFDRTHREPAPTEKAKALEPYLRSIYEQLKHLNTFARELSEGLESLLSIGISADINPSIIFDALKILNQRYPMLNIEVLTAPQDDLLPLLHQKRIQIALVFGGIYINPQEQFECIGQESLVATIAADNQILNQHESIFIEDLTRIRQITISSLSHQISDIRAVVSSTTWRTDNFLMALGMVEAGMGWGNLPLSLIKDKLAQGKLKRLHFKNTHNALKLPIHIVWIKGESQKRAAQEFVELLKTNISR